MSFFFNRDGIGIYLIFDGIELIYTFFYTRWNGYKNTKKLLERNSYAAPINNYHSLPTLLLLLLLLLNITIVIIISLLFIYLFNLFGF